MESIRCALVATWMNCREGGGGAVQQRGAEVSRRSSWDWCSVEELKKKEKRKTWQNKHNRILSTAWSVDIV